MKTKLKLFTSLLIIACAIQGTVLATEYKTANKFVRVTTNMLGYNFIAKKVAQGVIKKTLKESLNGDYKVKFDSFSGVDLKKGKFRGFTIDGKDLSSDDLSVSRLHLETTSDFNYVDYNKKPIEFKTDLPMKYEVELSESDLNKNFNTNGIAAICDFIPLVKIEKPTIKIVNDRIKLQSSLKMPLAKKVKFSMSTGLKVVDGKISLSKVETSGSKDFADKLVSLVNQKSLLEDINIPLLENTDTNVTVKTVNIKNGKIFIDGQLNIKKTD